MSVSVAQTCALCPHACRLAEGEYGVCGVRTLNAGSLESVSYGQISALSLDPIEKKPLACFHPGTMILSVGSFGCNLRCPFCQNADIAYARAEEPVPTHYISPKNLVAQAIDQRENNNIGIAYTYNEPFISWEYMRDCSQLAHKHNLLNVAVTNGYVMPAVWEEALTFIDALNIDLKCFSENGYRKLGAPRGLSVVKESIRMAVEAGVHVELTSLIVPGISDDIDLFIEECEWIASIDESIPLHITRFFPSFKMSEESPTTRSLLDSFYLQAQRRLSRVFLGNV